MVSVFGVGMTVHFNSKDLRLSAKISGTVFGRSKLDSLGNYEMSCRTIDWPMCVVCVIAKFG